MSERPDQARWSISCLEHDHHDCSGFDCGKEPLNEYLRKYAAINQRLGISQAFVATSPGSAVVEGYYCISAGAVEFKHLPAKLAKGLPRYPIPVAHMGRLAVDERSQGCRLGELLLFDAVERILRAADFIGVHAIEVKAKDEEAKGFYLKYGFRELMDDKLHLYVSIRMLRKLGLP